ncbi:MAG: RND family transporter [Candidatus Limimorpha sp.]
MWNKIADYILRYRVLNISVVLILLVLLIIRTANVKMAYNPPNTLPDDDSVMVVYRQFLERYGDDGCTIFVGIVDDSLFSLKHFQEYYDLCEEIRNVEGVSECLSVSRIYNIEKDDAAAKFRISEVVGRRPVSQTEVDSIKTVVQSLALYDGLLFNTEKNSAVMMIAIENDYANSNLRIGLVNTIKGKIEGFGERTGIDTHVSGLPYIREVTTDMMVREIVLFSVLSILVAALILYLLFRSWRVLVTVLSIVVVSVGYMFGIMSVLGYELTILTGVLPPLLIIIGVENSVFMLNKYNNEFSRCHDKFKALHAVIVRIGPANFLTNVTTAVSFASFIITRNDLLVPFGILSSVCIVIVFVLTLIMLPVFFSFQREPDDYNVNRINSGFASRVMERVCKIVENHRAVVYSVLSVAVVVCVIGAINMPVSGRVVDDISKKDKLYKDIMFFEETVGGVMPFEINIDTRKPKGIMNAAFIRKVDRLQDSLARFPEFSAPLSVAEVVKFARQGFFNGKTEHYKVPTNNEFGFIMKYLPDMEGDEMPSIMKQYMDKELRNTRVSVQMANITTPKIDSIMVALKPVIEEIFPHEKYDVDMTGNAVVTLKSTDFLLKNLAYSLMLAFLVISILMVIAFRDIKIVLISLIPNIIPLLVTAGVMGFSGIPLKMSTILVFSIALGISVDNTIHYLSRYRLQMKYNGGNVREAVFSAMMEAGPSMIYSASVLVCGFLIFALSSFGGTQVVGLLVPLTLLVSMVTNTAILPSLILTFNRKKI